MIRAGVLFCAFAAAALALAGCSSRPVQAPVIERAPPRPTPPAASRPAPPAVADTRPETYIVKRSDTLYSIALDHGLDYKELAAWNNIDNPSVIRPGQPLRIKPPAGVQEAPVVVRPVTSSGRIEGQPLGAQGPARAESAARPPAPPPPVAPLETVKSEPQARKLPYSPENLALLQRGDLPAKPVPAPEPALAPAPAAASPPKPEPAKPDADVSEEDRLEWGRPAQGKIIAVFSEPSNKGMDIAGKPGDPVIAAAPGRVIYSGEMRGYGKLAVVKHNKTYSSVYAHNRDILVKEGQSVIKGQKIAEIGNTDSDVPKLHFEIRKLGKPVDPAKYLPAQ